MDSPTSSVLSGRCDFLLPIPPCFDVFARTVPRKHSAGFVSPVATECQATGPELFTRYLLPGVSLRGDDRISYVPGGPPLCLCPALRPRRRRRTRPLRYDAAVLATDQTEDSRIAHFRGSITRLQHSLSTPSSAGYPVTTQDSLPAAGQALPDGLDYPHGPNERFQIYVMFIILLSQTS